MNLVLPLGRAAIAHGAVDGRLLLGIQVASDCGTVAGVAVRAVGRGLDAEFELLSRDTREVPADVEGRFQRLLESDYERPGDAGLVALRLADIQTELAERLLMAARCAAGDVLAVGVHDPGLWHVLGPHRTGYVSLCDAARLAEKTGLCVIDAFPARDLAAGGQGGPVAALAMWMLLHDPVRTRVLLDLGRTTRLTYLPPSRDASGAGGVLSFDVGPGTLLLDTLASQLSEGKFPFDPGGRLAVQGRRISDLIGHWLKDPYFQQPAPRWYPLGVRPDDEIHESVRMAVQSGWSIRDLLCTATHFIADTVERAFSERLPRVPPVDEVLISGGGQQNGMLLGEIGARLSGSVLNRTTESGMTDELLEATAVAALTLLHIDHVAANHPAITGTDAPRVLGRLTPGSATAWRKLLRMMIDGPRTTLLRDAV